MKVNSVLLLAIIASRALVGSTISDVSGRTTVALHTGDTLSFEILGGSFGVNARAFGLPADPTDFSFALLSAPTGWSAALSGTLEAADGTASVAFGQPLTFRDGFFSGAGYQGAVSILEGYLHLSPLLSHQIFSSASAMFTLHNNGPDLMLGLDPYTLRQDLYTSLSGGALSVGGVVGSVTLESASGPAKLAARAAVVAQPLVSDVPEPAAAGLLLGGGALLFGLSLVGSRLLTRPK